METTGLSSWVEVSLGAIADNVRTLKGLLGSGVLLTTVVKANGYGHGACEVAKVAIANGADRLAVARVEEGIQLRKEGIEVPIHILSGIPLDSVPEVVDWNLIPSLASAELLKAVSDVVQKKNKVVQVHIKVDTGMNRYGISKDQAVEFIKQALTTANIAVEGVFTHFASADEDDLSFTHEQAVRLETIIEELSKEGIRILLVHAANSAATLLLPQYYYDMVRVGLAAYGVSPVPKLPEGMVLKRAMSFKSRVSLIKRLGVGETVGYGRTFRADKLMTTALVMCGYADGLPRSISNRGYVLISGKRCGVLGRVSMDQITVDVSETGEVAVGDEVVLIGKQGEEEITASEVARWAGTISYEILTGIGCRVPRIYC